MTSQPVTAGRSVVVSRVPVVNSTAYNYQSTLFLSIIALFCCWPLGLAAIINAIQSRRNLLFGNTALSYQQALTARRLSAMAITFGIIIIVIIIIVSRIPE